MYQLIFLPIARQDMIDIVQYISHNLSNPLAASALANEMVEAAEQLCSFPYINVVHQTKKPLKHEYRKLFVKKYIMFYCVDEKEKLIMIARVIYARRDHENFLQ